MKLSTSALLLSGIAASHVLHAQQLTAPIEPLLVPVKNTEQGINVQMGQYEVTVAEFRRFINATGHEVPNKCMVFKSTAWPDPEKPGNWDDEELVSNPYRPAVCTGVEGARAYANWLSAQTGKSYRLPEWEEWKFAASAGQTSRFAHGDDFALTEICEYENIEDYANISGIVRHHDYRYDTSANCNDGAIYQTVVGMYRPNPLGLYDMIGNVRELLGTCYQTDDETQACSQYHVGGAAWHWQPRSVHKPDFIGADFYGSIEGFRLVLDSAKPVAPSAATRAFAQDLAHAQQQARVSHQQLQTIPTQPTAVVAKVGADNSVSLSWQAVDGKGVSYFIRRSYLDESGQVSRAWTTIAKDLSSLTYTDTLPGTGEASYKVFASTPVGESMASEQVNVGEHESFAPGMKVQAEQFRNEANTWVRLRDTEQSVVFSANSHHHPSGDIPYMPAWADFNFEVKDAGEYKLNMRFRADAEVKLNVWQGHHLVATYQSAGHEDFVDISMPASLLASDLPLQIRAANQGQFLIDWFEFVR